MTAILELFPCSGGLAEGFRRAGASPSVAFDYDDDACDSYEANHGHRPIQMDVRDLLRMARGKMLCGWWNDEPLRLLIADPPCTPWSRAGKRLGQADERDMLAVTVEIINILGPRSFLIANVPGLDDGPNWPIVQRVIGGIARRGYCIDFARLDAADYGVPQHRVRPFWYGHMTDAWCPTPCIQWPARTHASPLECRNETIPGVVPLRPWVTCRDALAHLPAEQLGMPIRLRRRSCSSPQHGSVPGKPARVVGTSNLSDGNVLLLTHPDAGAKDTRPPRPNHRPSRDDAPARTLTRNTHSDGALLVHARHPISEADQPSRTITTKGDGRGAQGACVLAWTWDRPSTTVTTREAVPPPGHHDASILSMPGAVKLSEKAAAILQGFPESWVFSGKTKAARWSMIGQAMPPPLAEAVARQVVNAMQEAPAQPRARTRRAHG